MTRACLVPGPDRIRSPKRWSEEVVSGSRCRIPLPVTAGHCPSEAREAALLRAGAQEGADKQLSCSKLPEKPGHPPGVPAKLTEECAELLLPAARNSQHYLKEHQRNTDRSEVPGEKPARGSDRLYAGISNGHCVLNRCLACDNMRLAC